jgi:hypothetical protein
MGCPRTPIRPRWLLTYRQRSPSRVQAFSGAQNRVISADVLLRASALRATDGGQSLRRMEHGYTGKAGTVNTWVGVTAPEVAS